MNGLLEYVKDIAIESENDLHVRNEIIAILDPGYGNEKDNNIN
jgi:hypothetical protein